MARPSPLTVAVGALAALVLGLAAYFVGRPRTPDAQDTAEAADAAAMEPSPGAPPAPMRAPEATRRPAVPSLPVPPPLMPTPAVGTSGRALRTAIGAFEGAPAAAVAPLHPVPTLNFAELARKRGQLVAWRGRWRAEADESVLDAMKLPEATRAAVRRINADAASRASAAAQANVQAAAVPPGAAQRPIETPDTGADGARQAELRARLGADAYATFETNERAAMQRLEGKYRIERAGLR